MLVLLPPSETKRDGGDGSPLDLAALSFPALAAHRRASLAALRRLSRSVGESTRVLGLGPTQRVEIDRNRAVGTSGTMPAMDRYTGVLFEALDAPSLPADARDWLGASVVVQSALLGPIRAGDPVPAYRLSHDSRLPGLALRTHWSAAATAVLAAEPGPILDLRSEGYAALAPLPPREDARYVRVVTAGPDGTRRALNHFNKKGKGDLVRALALARLEADSIDAVVDWAAGVGIRLEKSADARELDLVV